MNFGSAVLIIFSCCFLVMISACSAAPTGQATEKELTVTVLRSGRQCFPAPEEWKAAWISSTQALRDMMSRCLANRIGASSDAIPDVDFSRFGVIAVEMGEKPSSGYGFIEEGVVAHEKGRIVTVVLNHYSPAPGTATAQVMTNPWLLIQIPLGDYDGIRVEDSDSQLLTELGITTKNRKSTKKNNVN